MLVNAGGAIREKKSPQQNLLEMFLNLEFLRTSVLPVVTVEMGKALGILKHIHHGRHPRSCLHLCFYWELVASSAGVRAIAHHHRH